MSMISDFVRQVNRMRRAQKLYFKKKTRSSLEEAKRLEDSVDRMLQEIGFQDVKVKQLDLPVDGSKPN